LAVFAFSAAMTRLPGHSSARVLPLKTMARCGTSAWTTEKDLLAGNRLRGRRFIGWVAHREDLVVGFRRQHSEVGVRQLQPHYQRRPPIIKKTNAVTM
jgi:hypothetical protein